MADQHGSNKQASKTVEVTFPGAPQPIPLPVQNLSELIHDGRSWINFLKMLCGGQPARMRIKAEDKPEAEYVVVRMPRD